MGAKKRRERQMSDGAPDIWGQTPQALRVALLDLGLRDSLDLYLVGGTVRDWLLGLMPQDLDLCLASSAHSLAGRLRQALGEGAIVDLSGNGDEATRLVWRGFQVDFASFRAGAASIEEDLRRRDFTVNAMAVSLRDLAAGQPQVIDPTDGRADLQSRRLRHCPGAFAADPLRLVRGYRLSATLGFSLDPDTRAAVAGEAPAIAGVAAERISGEQRRIVAAPAAALTVRAMDEDRLLPHLFPELYLGAGVTQPGFHHLDVLGHSLLALDKMEEILAEPGRFFPGWGELLAEYLKNSAVAARLRWAALFHDLGKPATRNLPSGDLGRVTFYGHDQEGEQLFRGFAARSRWSREETEGVGRLIAMHMHPFHLCNVGRGGKISAKAVLRLCRRAGGDLAGLFLLAMADSLASLGAEKPPRMEEELCQLFGQVQTLYGERIAEALHGPPLLSGRDLIDRFGLVPGPLFRELLDQVTVARAEGKIADRQEALAHVAALLDERGIEVGAAGFRLVKES